MDYGRVQKSLLLYGIIVSTMISCSDAISIDFKFTVRQATYVAAGIAVFYIIFSIVIFLILCRVLNCKCCHKGKVCPRISSEATIHKGKDFVEIDMERFSKKKPFVEHGQSPRLGSIPEETVLTNPIFFEDDSETEYDSKKIVHHELESKVSILTMETIVPGGSDDDDYKMDSQVASRSSSKSGGYRQQVFDPISEEEAKQEKKQVLDNNGPLLREIAAETGMYQWFGVKKEEATDQEKTILKDKPTIERKDGLKLPNYEKSSKSKVTVNAAGSVSKKTLDLTSKHQTRKPVDSQLEQQNKTNPSAIATSSSNATSGSVLKTRTRSNDATKGPNKTQIKSYHEMNGANASSYNNRSLPSKNKLTPNKNNSDKSVSNHTAVSSRNEKSKPTVSASSRGRQQLKNDTSTPLAMSNGRESRNSEAVIVVEEEEEACELSFI